MPKMLDTADASTAAARADDLRAAGFGAIGLYLFRHSNFKELLTAEIAQKIGAAGLYVVTVYENGKPTAPGYFTIDTANSDAHAAFALAQGAGQPGGTPIYFAVDYDAETCDLPAIEAYFAEIRRALRLLGEGGQLAYGVAVYGSGLVCRRLHDAGLVSWTWLSGSSGWQGYADWKPHATIVQGATVRYYGMDVDMDTTNGAAGGWRI